MKHVTLLRFACILTSAAAMLFPDTAVAQPRPGYDPTSTHIFPAGGRRGTTVTVRVGTECAPPNTNFRIFGDGVSSPSLLGEQLDSRGEPSPRRMPTEIPVTYPREWGSQVTIPPNAALGAVHWRLSCGQGGTASRPFIIGDLPEHVENESNSKEELAERIDLPVTVNGQIHGERDVDFYRFTMPAAGIVSCEVMARRMGSTLDPVVTLLTADGEELMVDTAHVGNDPVVAFRAERAGDYLVRITNVGLHGSPSCVYRMNLTKKPFLTSVFPPSGEVGSESTLQLCVLDGSGEPGTLAADFHFPSEPGPFEYQHPGCSGTVTLVADLRQNRIEKEPNNDRETAVELPLPSTLSGRLQDARDEDWYRFTAAKDVTYTLQCEASPSVGDCLPTVMLADSNGATLADVRCVDSADRCCRINWKAGADGECLIRVRDMQFGVSGDDSFVYRLQIGPAKPDFEIQLGSDNFNLLQGGSGTVEVNVARSGGFLGPVELRFKGLPRGVEAENAKIAAKQDRAKVKLTSTDDVRAGSYHVEVLGRARLDGHTVEKLGSASHLGVDSEGVSIGPRRIDRWHLTVRHKPVFRLQCSEAYQYAHRGSVYPYLMEIERLDGFNGEIVMQQGDRQNRDMDGIEMLTTVVPRGVEEYILPIYLPETMHINVQSQSQLYSQAYTTFTDKHGQHQSMLVLAGKRNMIRTLPPVVKLTATEPEVEASPGESVTVNLALERTSNFPDAMRVEMLSELPGVEAESIEIAFGATEAQVDVRLDDAVDASDKVIRFRATGQMFSDTRVITESQVRLRVRTSQCSDGSRQRGQ